MYHTYKKHEPEAVEKVLMWGVGVGVGVQYERNGKGAGCVGGLVAVLPPYRRFFLPNRFGARALCVSTCMCMFACALGVRQ